MTIPAGLLNSESPVLAQRKNFLDKLKGNLFPVQPVEGLLTPEDAAAAQSQGLLGAGAALSEAGGWHAGPPVSVMQAIGRGFTAGQAAAQGAAGAAMERTAAGVDVAGKRQGIAAQRQAMDIQKQQADRAVAIQTQREAFFTRNPLPENPNEQQINEYLSKAVPFLMQIGDQESIPGLLDYLKSKSPKPLTFENAGDRILAINPLTGEKVAEYKVGQKPVDNTMRALAREDRQENQRFNNTNKLADDYRAETKAIAQAANQFQAVQSLAPGARAGRASDQIGLIFAIMKTFDPTSVVRESEYAVAQNAAGVPDRIRNAWNRLKDGGRLTPQQVDNFVKAAQSAASGWKRQQEGIKRIYDQRSQRWNLKPEDVTLDYFQGMSMGDGSGAGILDELFPGRRPEAATSDATRRRSAAPSLNIPAINLDSLLKRTR